MPNQAETLTTYKRADGQPVGGDYGWVADFDVAVEIDDSFTPVTYVREVWQRVRSEERTHFPKLYDCDLPDCDNDADSWIMAGGGWHARCGDHGG